MDFGTLGARGSSPLVMRITRDVEGYYPSASLVILITSGEEPLAPRVGFWLFRMEIQDLKVEALTARFVSVTCYL